MLIVEHFLPQLVQFLSLFLFSLYPRSCFQLRCKKCSMGSSACLSSFNFFFCSCFPSTFALVFSCDARSDQWAPVIASARSISFFVLVFPLPSLLFSAAMQEVINGLQCLPQLVHFLHFLFVSPLPSPKFYTQALDQEENKPRPRAKGQGPRQKGKRTKAKGPMREGPRAKAKGPRAKAKGPRAKEPRQKGKRAKGQGAKEPRANDPRPAQTFGEITFCETFPQKLKFCMYFLRR